MQVSQLKTQAGLFNLMSSSSSFFTLLLAAIYPSSSADKFTISKLAAVVLSILGVVNSSFIYRVGQLEMWWAVSHKPCTCKTVFESQKLNKASK